MRQIALILLLFSSCFLRSQEKKEFQDYLSHFMEKGYSSRFESDSLNLIFDNKDTIPSEYAKQYIEDFKSLGKWKYRYVYGTKVDIGSYIVVFVFRDCDEFVTKWGCGIRECFALVYSLDGELKSKALICKKSDEQFFEVSYHTLGDTNIDLFRINVVESTLRSCLDGKEQIYEGVKYSRDYCVYNGGMIHYAMQFKDSDIKVIKRKGFKVIEEHEVWQDNWIKYTNATPYNESNKE